MARSSGRKLRAGGQALLPIPTAESEEKQPDVPMPALGGPDAFASIEREIQIKTNVPADKPRYEIEEYRVVRGDSVFAIAESFKIQPETVLWANYDVLQDDPHSLAPGHGSEDPANRWHLLSMERKRYAGKCCQRI